VASLVSAGTEKHMLEVAKKFLVGRVLARPGLVHLVALGHKMRKDIIVKAISLRRWKKCA